MRIVVLAAALISAAPLAAAEPEHPWDTERMAQVCRQYAGPAQVVEGGEQLAKLSPAQLEAWRRAKLTEAMARYNMDPSWRESAELMCQLYVRGVQDTAEYVKPLILASK